MMGTLLINPAYAENGEGTSVPFIVTAVGKTAGTVMSILARFFNMITGTDEADIEKADIGTPSWKEYTEGEVISDPEQVIYAKTWVANELVFVSEKTYKDPFSDVDTDLVLWGNGRQYTVPGFWDGGNVWKVRFVCPSEGEWYYRTVCTDTENTALHGREGKVICEEYSGEHEIYKRGFVTVNAGEKYFTYDDGTPFFYLGDTHWSLGDETADMVKTICEKRVSQGFTVYQSEPIGEKFGFADGITEADMAGLRNYDEKFRIIAEHGLTHANAQFMFPSDMETLIRNFGGYSEEKVTDVHGGKNSTVYELSDGVKEYLEKISRYWVARYGAYPVMWTLGQEVDNDFYHNETSHPDWNSLNNPYIHVAEYIEKYDAYDHPLTAHQENASQTSAYGNGEGASQKLRVYREKAVPSCFRDVKAHDFYAAQWSPSKTKQNDFEVEKDYWYNGQGKPSINYEGQYCYLWTKNYGARMQGWLAYLGGMYGYGWGGHDTWSYLNIYDEENDSSDGVDTITSEEKKNATWLDSLEYDSSYQVGYMKNFLMQTKWHELIPRFGNKAYFVPCHGVYYVYASNGDNSEIVIYFYSFTDGTVAEKTNTKRSGGIMTGTVGNLVPGEKYIYTWFDPINGEVAGEGEFTANRFGTHFMGERPTNTDMALMIKLA